MWSRRNSPEDPPGRNSAFGRRGDIQTRPLLGLSLAGLALLPAPPFGVAAQDDAGALEVLVEDTSGPRSPDGALPLTFEARTVPNLERVEIGKGRSFTDSGQRIGTGSGTVVTPTLTVSDLVTEASVYPQEFSRITKDAQGRIWTTAKDPGGVYVFDSSSWRHASSPRGALAIGRDAQGTIWAVGTREVYRISGNELTVFSGFRDLGVGTLSCFAAGTGDTVWVGGFSLEGGNAAAFLRFDGQEWRLFSLADGLSDYSWIDAVAVDSTGTVWGVAVYDAPDHIDPPASFVPYSLVSYDGREWRGYQVSLARRFLAGSQAGMLVDPGGTLWISTPHRLVRETASGWMVYEFDLGLGGRSIAAERAGRIWVDGGSWIGVFESGQLHRTPIGSTADAFTGQAYRAAQKLYYDGEVLWMANRRLARWRLPRRPTSVGPGPGHWSSAPSRLLESHPNPFNASTTIVFELDRRQPVSLRIHSITGQLVATLAESVYPAGVFSVSWDGSDARGGEVASGVYVYRLVTAKGAQTRKLTLLR